MASIQTRVDEANRFLQNGHKYLKTSLLQWQPDHDNAANQFVQAAMSFKNAGLHHKAIEANELAIKSYLATGSANFQAAKCLEQCAQSSKDLGDFQAAATFFTRAVDIYKNTGYLDSAIAVLERAAKLLKNELPAIAAEFYIQASEFCAIEDRYRQAAEFCGYAALLYVKSGDLEKAAHIQREEVNCLIQCGSSASYKSAICLILIHLSNNNNIVAAGDVVKSYKFDEESQDLANRLVFAFEKKDGIEIDSLLGRSYFKDLDSGYAKLARDLKKNYGHKSCERKDISEAEQQEIDEAALL